MSICAFCFCYFIVLVGNKSLGKIVFVHVRVYSLCVLQSDCWSERVFSEHVFFAFMSFGGI